MKLSKIFLNTSRWNTGGYAATTIEKYIDDNNMGTECIIRILFRERFSGGLEIGISRFAMLWNSMWIYHYLLCALSRDTGEEDSRSRFYLCVARLLTSKGDTNDTCNSHELCRLSKTGNTESEVETHGAYIAAINKPACTKLHLINITTQRRSGV